MPDASLTKAQIKRFRSIGHQLNPVVTIAGNGLSETVVTEINRALGDHELIKIKVIANDREEKATTIAALTESCHAVLIQQIGNIALIYQAAKRPDPKLSNVLRAARS